MSNSGALRCMMRGATETIRLQCLPAYTREWGLVMLNNGASQAEGERSGVKADSFKYALREKLVERRVKIPAQWKAYPNDDSLDSEKLVDEIAEELLEIWDSNVGCQVMTEAAADHLHVLIKGHQPDLFQKLFELLEYPPVIPAIGGRKASTFQFAYDTNSATIFKYLMKQQIAGNMLAFYSSRVLILECSFITKEERQEALDQGLTIQETPAEYTNAEFTSTTIEDVSQLLYVDECPNVDYITLPDKVPVQYKTYKEKVEYGTINYAMGSVDLIDDMTAQVLEQGSDSHVHDEFSPVNDEIIQTFIDYHWNRHYYNISIASFYYIMYGLMLVGTAFTDNEVLKILTFMKTFALIMWEFYFLHFTMIKVQRQNKDFVQRMCPNPKLFAKGIKEHFSGMTNLLDLIGQLCFVLYFCIDLMDGLGEADMSYHARVFHFIAIFAGTLNSVTTFFNLFKQTRYLNFLVGQVITDFFPFFCVFFVSICLQGILTVYLQVHMDEKGYITPKDEDITVDDAFMVSWKIMLVDYGADNYVRKTFVGNVVYLVFSLWLIIIMLNLLIAIIGNTYSEVNSVRKATDYKVKSQILLLMSQIYKLTRGSPCCICIRFPVVLILVILTSAYTFVFYFLYNVFWKPLRCMLICCKCKKKYEENYESSFVINEGGEDQRESLLAEEEIGGKYFFLHVVRKLQSKETTLDFNSKITQTIDFVNMQFDRVEKSLKADNQNTREAVQKMEQKYEETQTMIEDMKFLLQNLARQKQ